MTSDEYQRASGRRARRRGRTWSAHRHRADRPGPPGTRRAGLRRGTPHAPGALQPPTAPGNQARAAKATARPEPPRPESERPSPGPEPPSPRPAPPRPDNGWAVETHGLSKRFGPTVAVDDVELLVPRGSAFGYLGPNGAGKTTLIRTLLGLTRANAGTMSLLGTPVPAERDRRLVGHRRLADDGPRRLNRPGHAQQLRPHP